MFKSIYVVVSNFETHLIKKDPEKKKSETRGSDTFS